MPRPKGTFKTPEQLAKMTPEQREKYRQNHADYKQNFARREKAARKIPSYVERGQRAADIREIDWDCFPETLLREWLRTNCPNQGLCRHQAARWGVTVGALRGLLEGSRRVNVEVLQKISVDTSIGIEKLLSDFDEAKAKKEMRDE